MKNYIARLYNRIAYSKSIGKTFNHLTLSVNDKEIKQMLEVHRYTIYKKTLPWFIFGATCSLISHIINLLRGHGTPFLLLIGVLQQLYLIMMWLLIKYKPLIATKFIIIYTLIHVVITNLVFRD